MPIYRSNVKNLNAGSWNTPWNNFKTRKLYENQKNGDSSIKKGKILRNCNNFEATASNQGFDVITKQKHKPISDNNRSDSRASMGAKKREIVSNFEKQRKLMMEQKIQKEKERVQKAKEKMLQTQKSEKSQGVPKSDNYSFDSKPENDAKNENIDQSVEKQIMEQLLDAFSHLYTKAYPSVRGFS